MVSMGGCRWIGFSAEGKFVPQNFSSRQFVGFSGGPANLAAIGKGFVWITCPNACNQLLAATPARSQRSMRPPPLYFLSAYQWPINDNISLLSVDMGQILAGYCYLNDYLIAC